jgi:hypothetical protein
MSALSIQPTYPIFTDIDGQPLEAGYVWIGTANLDPQTNPITVYWDAALTILAPQPIRTLAGYPSNNGTPARLYVNSDYSIRVMNKNGSTVYSAPAATERYNGGVISTINASQVVYDPAGLGAVPTTVQAKLRETVSVKDFGAVGDGVTDDTAAIQAALDVSFVVLAPAGSYKTGKLSVAAGTKLYGDHYGATNFIGTDATIIELNNDPSYIGTLRIQIQGITFKASVENTTTAIRGENDTGYITYMTVRDCHFWNELKYGVYGNFLQCRFQDCHFGYYGSATTKMTTGIYINGQSGVEANANTIDSCYIANTSDVGVYISTGWGNQLNNTTVEVTGKEAVVIDGGLQTSLIGCYFERCFEGHTPSGSESIIRTANNATTGDGVYAVYIAGCLMQSSVGIAGGYLINSAGSAIVQIEGCGIGGLAANPISLSPGNQKVLFGDTNYYPGGFIGFSSPKIARNPATYYESFDEESVEIITNIDEYVKSIRHRNGSNITNGSVLGLLSDRPPSGAYKLLRARVDMAGTPKTVLTLYGNGDLQLNGLWNDGLLRLGNYYLWVDATGDLRIKSGAPASDTDGTVVGTQT